MDFERLRDFRRELHRNAEPAFVEIGTAARIEDAIKDLPVTLTTGPDAQHLDPVVDFPTPAVLDQWEERAVLSGVAPERAKYFRHHGTAIVADIEGRRPGPRWGLRADIDALPLAESLDPSHLPAASNFASLTGAMHACGHDVNATIGVGLLHRLCDREFSGSLRVLFQPAEEGVRGAQTMLDAGVVDGIDKMLALHIIGDMPMGSVVGSFTGGMATRKLKVAFQGKASHAAGAPEEGRNALLASAMAALAIMAIPRFNSADTRLNVGTLSAGNGVNIVPSSAVLTCEARASIDSVVDELVSRITSIVEGCGMAQDVKSTWSTMGQSVTISPDDALVNRIVDVARGHSDVHTVQHTRDLAGSDDANLLIRQVQRQGGQGAYMMIGGSSPGPHHSALFDVDERAIPIGIDILESLIRAG